MARCIIFGAAEFDSLLLPIEKDDLIIAADGGLRHFQGAARQPDVILGDFDSLGYVPQGAQVFPMEKDDTDVMLAVRHGLQAGFREFLIYGGMDGPRVDHTIANFQTLGYLRARDARGFLVGKTHIATVISGETAVFSEDCTGILSVFCLGQDAAGVTIRGLQYPLEKGTLTASHPLGVSNHFVGKQGEIRVENGSLLLIWEVKNGLPDIG
ncbi:MAG: thiamine diphosphokinase [Ruminococcaceae bacterium]|nr:thiamine diphosphokinase [Oscillospiraceae bacterium]